MSRPPATTQSQPPLLGTAHCAGHPLGAGSANTSHSCEHVHVEINSANYLTAFLITFPIPFGTSIRIAYFNINAGQTANIYSMVTYRPDQGSTGSITPTCAYDLRKSGQ